MHAQIFIVKISFLYSFTHIPITLLNKSTKEQYENVNKLMNIFVPKCCGVVKYYFLQVFTASSDITILSMCRVS